MAPKKISNKLRESLEHIPKRQSSARATRSTSRSPHGSQAKSRKQEKPKKRFNFGDKAGPRQIHMLQQTVHHMIPRAPFSRLVRETMQNCSRNVTRVTSEAFEAILESTEIYLVQMFEDAYRITLNRNQVTLQDRDLELLRFLRGASDPGVS